MYIFAYTQWLKGINVRFLLAPWKKNHLSSWLARHDSWYSRHIFVPFRSPSFLLPWCSLRDDDSKGEEEESQGTEATSSADLNAPGRFLRDVMTDYAREATGKCMVNVYLLEGWFAEVVDTGKKLETEPDASIPFTSRIVIGNEAEDVARAQGKKANTVSPEMEVKFSKMDLDGNPGVVITDDPVPYQSILIANTPRTGDSCFPADPTAPWLEMHAASSAAKFGRSSLLNDPKQHVGEVEISSSVSTSKFHVIIDDECFGPYHHVRISRATYNPPDSTDKYLRVPFALPVATFFPIENI